MVSFAVARVFTTFYPDTSLMLRGYHIHHFWFGVALLAIGGWLGISYESERTNRIAAILFGAGGGLIGDEIGLLLTFGNYWTDITYTLVVIFLALASTLIIIARYWEGIRSEFNDFLKSNISLYTGVFLFAVSVAFILQTRNQLVITASSIMAIVGLVTILAYFVQHIITRRRKKKE